MSDIVEVKGRGGSARFEVRDPNEHIQRHWARGGFYEAGMLDWIRRHHKGGTFIDAGACIGNHTVYFAKLCGAERVVAVEPVPELMDHLQSNLCANELLRRVIQVEKALSDEPGWGLMEDLAPNGHRNAGMHRLNTYDPIFKNGTTVTTLDRLIERLDLRDVTLVKIDVEHSELDVLRGAWRLLRDQRPALYVELTEANYDEAVAFLKLFGYRLASQHNVSPTYGFVVPRGWKPLRVLHVSKFDFAACGYYLSRAFKDHTAHEARAVRFKTMRIAFPSDVTTPSDVFLRDLWNGSDVVHFHDAPPKLPDGLDPKPTVITFHGSQYRSAPDKWNALARESGWVLTAATLDLVALGAGWLPDCRPDLSRYRDPADEFLIVHSPAHRREGPGRGKGTDEVIAACKEAGVALDLVEAVPHEVCLERKGRAHLVIDQFNYGPGCNAIEAWAMGIPVIADFMPDLLGEHLKRFGQQPFHRPLPTLEEAIVEMRDLDKARSWTADAGRQFWKCFHSPLAVASRALAYYEKAMLRDVRPYVPAAKRPKMPPKGQLRPEGMKVLRYLGQNQGEHSWHPEGGTGVRYLFSAERADRFVYEPDVEWFLSREKDGHKLFQEVG